MDTHTPITSPQDWYKIQEVSLVYRSSIKASTRPVLREPGDVYALLLQTWDRSTIQLQEQFSVLLLNGANKLLGIFVLSSGGLSATVVDPRLIFSAALKAGACNLIVAHNHPSGNLKPSRADELLTRKLVKAGALLDIAILDHLVIGEEGFFSFASQGLL